MPKDSRVFPSPRPSDHPLSSLASRPTGGRRELGVRGRELHLLSRPVPISWTGKVRSNLWLMGQGKLAAVGCQSRGFALVKARSSGAARPHPSFHTASPPRSPGFRAASNPRPLRCQRSGRAPPRAWTLRRHPAGCHKRSRPQQ